MNKHTRELLGLQAYRVRAHRRLTPEEEAVAVELPVRAPCPRCRTVTSRVHQRAPQASRVLWSFLNGQRLWLLVHRRRLRCPCGHVFTQPLPAWLLASG